MISRSAHPLLAQQTPMSHTGCISRWISEPIASARPVGSLDIHQSTWCATRKIFLCMHMFFCVGVGVFCSCLCCLSFPSFSGSHPTRGIKAGRCRGGARLLLHRPEERAVGTGGGPAHVVGPAESWHSPCCKELLDIPF